MISIASCVRSIASVGFPACQNSMIFVSACAIRERRTSDAVFSCVGREQSAQVQVKPQRLSASWRLG